MQFTSPVMGRYGQYIALIPPGTILGERREITIKSPDLCGLMDQFDDLFGPSRNADCYRNRPADEYQERSGDGQPDDVPVR
jgi:hypothetical protein